MARALTALDTARFAWHLGGPAVLGGVVAPNPRFTPYLVRRQATATAFAFLGRIRQEYGPRVWMWLPPAWTLLVLDQAGIAEVLESDANFADPAAKSIPLSRLTPNGVIVSRGEEWRLRRMLNDDALAFGRALHPASDDFLEIADGEVGRLLGQRPGVLAWRNFSELAGRIAQQVMFGRARFDPAIATRMARVASSSNWARRRRSDLGAIFDHFQADLTRPPSGQDTGAAPAQRCHRWLEEHEDSRQIADAHSQMAFWLFVIKDALELHVSRTLALIASAPDSLRHRIRAEVHQDERLTAESVERAVLLEGCIKEELRLWTAVPVLLRRAIRDCRLDDTLVRAGQQMLLHVGFYHRDPTVFGATADRFDPEQRSRDDRSNEQSATNSTPPLYVFSSGRQACAGQFVAMFLLKATLAGLLRRVDVTLQGTTLRLDQIPSAIDPFHLRFAVRTLDT